MALTNIRTDKIISFPRKRLYQRRQAINAETADWVARVVAAGSTVSQPVANAVSAFVDGCQADGIWDAMKSVVLLAGADTLAGALAPLKGTAPTSYNFASGDYNKTSGLKGNGSSTYLDSNRANNADPQDSNHVSVFLAEPNTVENGNVFGTDGVLAAGGNNMYRSGTSLLGANRGVGSGPAFTIIAEGATAGFKGYSRSASAGFSVRTGSASTAVTATSSTPTSRTVFIFGRNDLSSPPQFLSDARLSFYSIGESLDLALLDARVSALMTAIGVS